MRIFLDFFNAHPITIGINLCASNRHILGINPCASNRHFIGADLFSILINPSYLNVRQLRSKSKKSKFIPNKRLIHDNLGQTK